ncbi:hypothetical protein HYFRA_00002320 [Hymenoscyphus fraxineus]|uniref:2EXR domain-containing protein n=1 Tax=Hymenoscyphus fraxineus TaxID=746836 RepID=A0A9N9LA27_9HELO|nr:hypothetical protein HYFRA_00002320 [Hymenoscyphus fraxineus]
MTANWVEDEISRPEWSLEFWDPDIVKTLSMSKTPLTFPLFNNLPKELREQIWDLALPDPQVITITLVHDEETIAGSPTEKEGTYGTVTRLVEKCHAIYDFPSLLLVNSEARERALRHYKLCFEDNFIYPIYFDATRDTLHLDSCNTLTAFKYFIWSREDLQTMKETRFLGIGGKIALWFSFMGMRRDSASCLLLFENLETLSFEQGEEGDLMFAGRTYEDRIVNWLESCWRHVRMGLLAESENGSDSDEVGEGGLGNIPVEDDHQDDATSSDGDIVRGPMASVPKITFMSRQKMQDLGMCLLWEG